MQSRGAGEELAPAPEPPGEGAGQSVLLTNIPGCGFSLSLFLESFWAFEKVKYYNQYQLKKQNITNIVETPLLSLPSPPLSNHLGGAWFLRIPLGSRVCTPEQHVLCLGMI